MIIVYVLTTEKGHNHINRLYGISACLKGLCAMLKRFEIKANERIVRYEMR